MEGYNVCLMEGIIIDERHYLHKCSIEGLGIPFSMISYGGARGTCSNILRWGIISYGGV